MRKSGGTFHLADDGIERAVGVLRRTEIAQAGVRLAGKAFQKRSREPRFANAGLTGEKHHLAFAILCSCPASQQQFGFFFPADKRGEVSSVQCIEPALDRACPHHRPRPHRPGDPFEVSCPEIDKLKEIAQKFSRALGNNQRIRLRNSLQARGKIWRLADNSTLHRAS